jgi:putative membrane protein
MERRVWQAVDHGGPHGSWVWSARVRTRTERTWRSPCCATGWLCYGGTSLGRATRRCALWSPDDACVSTTIPAVGVRHRIGSRSTVQPGERAHVPRVDWTTLALLAAGVALEALEVPPSAGFRLASALTFVVLAVLAALQAWIGWARTERALREARSLPAPSLGVVITGGVIAACVMLGLGFVL